MAGSTEARDRIQLEGSINFDVRRSPTGAVGALDAPEEAALRRRIRERPARPELAYTGEVGDPAHVGVFLVLHRPDLPPIQN